jgi:hypothetical protein
MKHHIIATAFALLFVCPATAPNVVAQGKGGGKSGGGFSGGAKGHSASAKAKGGSVKSGGVTSRGGRSGRSGTVVGTAVPRSPRPRDPFVVTPSVYSPRFFRPHFTDVGFGFGYRRFRFGYGFGPAYFYDFDYFGGMYPSPYADMVAPEDQEPLESGSVRLQVEPATAQIFVDGEYVGTVDDFQSRNSFVVEAGVHRVEFRATGYDPLVVHMRIAPGGRITYRAALKPSQP